jgi:hypothetical protein
VLSSVECGSYARIYVVEDLGHIVNMVEEAISREVVNLLSSKSSTFSRQLSAETVCSSVVCPLTPSNAEVCPTTANVVNAATGIIPLCFRLCAFGLFVFYPFVCLTMHSYMHNGYQTFKINVSDHFYW